MSRGEPVVWMMFAMSIFGLLLPNLAAGQFEDPKPLRLMALAVFVLTGTTLADKYLFDDYLFDSVKSMGKTP